MFQNATDQNDYRDALELIAAYDSLATADISLPGIVALVDAYAGDDNFQGHELADLLDVIIPTDDLQHFEWLIDALTGPSPNRHRWYRDEETGQLRRHVRREK